MDVGTKTIGLALRVRAGASRVQRIRSRVASSRRTRPLAAFMAEQQVKGIVIGLLLNLDGTPARDLRPVKRSRATWRTLACRSYSGTSAGPTSQAVTRMMIEADTSRARRSELVDKLAASYILQGAIDALTTLHRDVKGTASCRAKPTRPLARPARRPGGRTCSPTGTSTASLSSSHGKSVFLLDEAEHWVGGHRGAAQKHDDRLAA